MTSEPVALADLLAARDRMVLELREGLDAAERRFLLSLVAGEPEWALLGLAHLQHLPGIRWKLLNLHRLKQSNAKIYRAIRHARAAALLKIKGVTEVMPKLSGQTKLHDMR